MKYKVIALDIDGTLTNTDKVMTPETVKAVIDLQKEGLHVVIASGRSEYGFRHIADELQFDKYGNYIMSFNGGRIMNYATGEIVYDNPLPLSYIQEIYDIAVKYDVGILGYDRDCLISGNGIDEYQELDAWACKMNLKETDDFPSYFSKAFNKCLLTGEPEKLKEVLPLVKAQLDDRLNVFLSEEFYIEVVPQGVHKAAALGQLLEKLGCTREELVCVGDGMNDKTMIEYAGLGVAMGNANPAVKEVADYITDTNDNDGVVKLIEKLNAQNLFVRK